MRHLESTIAAAFQDKRISHIALRIGRGSETLYSCFHSAGSAIDEHTLFDMASVTKTVVTAPLTLLLIDQGLVQLDDPVNRFFSCPPDKAGLTVRMLLTHTMGIGHRSMVAPGNTYDNIADHILSNPCEIPPGSDVLYSCPAYILLGKIIEKVLGARLDRLFDTYLKDTMGMTHSGYLPAPACCFVNSNVAPSEKGMVNDYNCRFLGGVAGNAGLFSTLCDMTSFVRFYLSGGTPLLLPGTLQYASRNATPGMAESRGLGFVYVDEKFTQTGGLFPVGSVGHCGHTGQSCFIDPKGGFYVIILTDATVCTVKKYGTEHYDEVIALRRSLHSSILHDFL